MKTKEQSGIRLFAATDGNAGRLPWLVPGLLGLLLAAVAVFWSRFSNGLALAYNRLCALWTEATGQILLRMPAREADRADLWLFLLLFGVLMALLLGLLGKKWPAAAAFALMPPVVGVALVLPKWAPWLALPLLAAAILLAMGRPARGGGQKRMALLKATACLLCAGLLFVLLPGELSFASLRQQAEEGLHRSLYEPEGRLLPEGDLTSIPQSGSLPVLEVTMEQPEELYLRGFVGETYDGTRWQAVEYGELAGQSDLVYWLHAGDFYPQTQFARAAEAARADLRFNRVTVSNLAACGKYLYVPYQLSSLDGGGQLPAMKLDNAALYAQGNRNYTFTALYRASEQTDLLLERLQAGGAETQAFLSAEGSYRALVLENSLAVTDEALGELKPTLDAICAPYGGRDTLSLEQAELCALKFLESHQGENAYDQATAAVLALRYYGIPARYAEGWHISQAMADTAAGQAVTVTGAHARAWAEIYQDGLGWMPLELTPGYQTLSGQVSQEGAGAQGGSQTDQNLEDIPQGEELEEPDTREEHNQQAPLPEQPQTETPRIRLLPVLLAALALLLLILLLIWLRHRRILGRRQAAFRSEHIGDAIGWLFLDAAVMLEKLGLSRGKGSMEPVCAEAEARFGAEYGLACREMSRLNSEALFSSHAFTEEQRTLAADFRGKTLSLLRSGHPWYRRLWIKWIECIY